MKISPQFIRQSISKPRLLVACLAVLLAPAYAALAWAPKHAPIETPWAAKVDPANVLPDYPRPQLVRADWLNLNGVWEYQPGAEGDVTPAGQHLASEILVPFGVESALSGVMEHHDRLWYRRMFEVPAGWAGRRIILNFGAVDYESEVFINGKSMGIHLGGYDPFHYDITDALTNSGPQEIIVRVYDPTEKGGQPRGKQTTTPGGIMYTPTTGIWQTVWLEPRAAGGIESLHIVPDLDHGLVRVTVNTVVTNDGTKVDIKVTDSGAAVATMAGAANTELAIPISNPKLWSPDSPFLYDLEVTVSDKDTVTDTVKSYFGMRDIKIGDVDGVKRLLLNGKFVFQFGPLDQGFWPDGIYTAPTEEAMKNDISQMKALGFNMVRKHIKVEPYRWYYWTDKLGLLVWQDMPSADSYMGRKAAPPVDRGEFESELIRMVQTHWNTPSIVTWVTFNEGQGQPDEQETRRLVGAVKAMDPSRLVNEASGSTIYGSGDFNDLHSYPAPNVRPITTPQAYVCGEYGGIGLLVDGHTWNGKGGGYEDVLSGSDLLYLYNDFAHRIKKMRDEKGLSAVVYTQLTDVMTEINGLMTYDRVLKVDPALLAKATRFELPDPTYQVVLPTSEETAQTWKYTTNKPAANWNSPDFDDSAWADGPGGFGKHDNLGATPWTDSNIWLRRHFNPGNLSPDQVSNMVVKDFHAGAVEVFINGTSAYGQKRRGDAYEYHGMTAAGHTAVNPNADNVLAVHSQKSPRTGENYIDVGLYLRQP